jgi:hypothetical protein
MPATKAQAKANRRAVHAGAEWLDQQDPAWRDKITMADLRLANPYQCVLGQVFRDNPGIAPRYPEHEGQRHKARNGWHYAVSELIWPSKLSPYDLGFCATGLYSDLTEAWLDLLSAGGTITDEDRRMGVPCVMCGDPMSPDHGDVCEHCTAAQAAEPRP